jgi:hypothetical protein
MNYLLCKGTYIILHGNNSEAVPSLNSTIIKDLSPHFGLIVTGTSV